MMKMFMTVLLASIAYTTADVSLQAQGYHHSNGQLQQQPPIQLLHQQHRFNQYQQQQQQLQQQQQSYILNQLPFNGQPNQQYLPSQQQIGLLMPADFPGQPIHTAGNVVRQRRPRVRIPKKAIVTKNFFIHSAPDDTEEEIQDELAQLAQQPRKHYNVLFVKTPSQTSKVTAVNLANALKEEKTVVYVLSKKTTASDLQEAIAEAPQTVNKPEVFFIKYRTPEEAVNAQRQIQSQYDSLGGTSTITDEGYSPVASVIGSLDAPQEEEEEDIAAQQQLALQQQQQQQQQQYQLNLPIQQQQYDSELGSNNQYLPPNQS